MRYIDPSEPQGRWGVEPICTTLQFAPATYYAAKAGRPAPGASATRTSSPRSPGSTRRTVDVYGADKVWTQLNREGIPVARCTVERLMGDLGLRGCDGDGVETHHHRRRGLHRPADLVDRQFVADRPNRLWVADLTYVKTHAGWVYVAFVLDVFSRFVVGWQMSTSLRSDLAIDALEMAIYARRGRASTVSSITATGACNISRFATPSAWPKPAS